MATHITNIQNRNYVTLASGESGQCTPTDRTTTTPTLLGRTLVPTRLGISLVHGYYRIDPDLVLPKVHAHSTGP